MYANGVLAVGALGLGAVAAPAAGVPRDLLIVTGAGFGVFLIVWTALLTAGFILRGVDRVRGEQVRPAQALPALEAV